MAFERDEAFWGFVLLLIVGLLVNYLVERLQKRNAQQETFLDEFSLASFLLIFAGGVAWLTWTEVQKAYATALKTGKGLDIWSQIILISAGFLLLLLAWWVWESASHRPSTTSTGG